MGYAQGLLLREDLHELLPLYESYLENSLDHYLSHLPKDVADFIIVRRNGELLGRVVGVKMRNIVNPILVLYLFHLSSSDHYFILFFYPDESSDAHD